LLVLRDERVQVIWELVEVTIMLLLLSFAAAIFAGFIGALFGVGGGIVIIPFLTTIVGLPIHEAIAISIVTVIATSNAGGSSYVEQKIANVRLAMFLEVGTTAGALIGSILALILQSFTLFFVLGVVMLYISFSQLNFRRNPGAHLDRAIPTAQDPVSKYLGLKGTFFDAAERKTVEYHVTGAMKGSSISLFAGILSGLLGVGGGVIKVAAMNVFMNVPMKVSIATSKFMIGVTAVTGALLFFIAGLVDIYLLAPIAIGTTLGATLGTLVFNRIHTSALKKAFGILVIYLAYTMFAQGFALAFGIHLPLGV
jgi:uncharacterized membrane protein YfcA